jgi:hypothetical protein
LGTEYNIKDYSYEGRTEKMATEIVFSKKHSFTTHLTGYKTFKDIHLYLSPINILIGANGIWEK